jgi:hypothetical protein
MLNKNAQELIVVDPATNNNVSLEPIEVSENLEDLIPEHQHGNLEVGENGGTVELTIGFDEVPGAPNAEPILEVTEDSHDKEKPDSDENDDSSKPGKWDWQKSGPTGFVAWVKERIDNIPQHSGYDSAGLQRAMSYLEKLDAEISKAMRLDLDGELDANKVEEVRSKIDDGVNRLHDRLDKVMKNKKIKRKKKSNYEIEGLVKEAQKITGVQGIYITVPLIISRVARICINSMVSSGKDIEHSFHELSKKYKLTDREQAETIQLLDDMGYRVNYDPEFLNQNFVG